MTNPYDAMGFGGMYYRAKQINIWTATGESGGDWRDNGGNDSPDKSITTTFQKKCT